MIYKKKKKISVNIILNKIKINFLSYITFRPHILRKILIICQLGLIIGTVYLLLEAISDYFDITYCDDTSSDSGNTYISFIKKNWFYITMGLVVVTVAAVSISYCGPLLFNKKESVETSTQAIETPTESVEILTRTVGTQTGVDTSTDFAKTQLGVKTQTKIAGILTEIARESVETQTDVAGILTEAAKESVETQTDIAGISTEIAREPAETPAETPRPEYEIARNTVPFHMEHDLLKKLSFEGGVNICLTEEGYYRDALFKRIYEVDSETAERYADDAAVWFMQHRIFKGIDELTLLEASRRITENFERFNATDMAKASEYIEFFKGSPPSRLTSRHLVQWLRKEYEIKEEDLIDDLDYSDSDTE